MKIVLNRRALPVILQYMTLIVIALVCVFPFWWTLVTAISTEGNIFSFPPTFWPKSKTCPPICSGR